MKIRSLKEKTDQLKEFEEKQWQIANEEHHEEEFNFKKENHIFIAEDQVEIVGLVEFNTSAGVCHLATLLVSNKHRRRGIGKMLVEKAENQCRELKIHKIFLNTGKEWDSAKFYRSLGFQEEAISKDHYGHQDYIQFVKFL